MGTTRNPLTALQVLEKARKACNPPTWYQLAKRLHTTPQVIATWRARGGTYDEEGAWEIAEILGMTPGEVIAIREADRDKNEERKARWRKRLRGIAGAFVAMLCLQLFHSGIGDAWAISHWNNSSPDYKRSNKKQETTKQVFTNLQIMRQHLRRLRERLARLWRRGFARLSPCRA